MTPHQPQKLTPGLGVSVGPPTGNHPTTTHHRRMGRSFPFLPVGARDCSYHIPNRYFLVNFMFFQQRPLFLDFVVPAELSQIWNLEVSPQTGRGGSLTSATSQSSQTKGTRNPKFPTTRKQPTFHGINLLASDTHTLHYDYVPNTTSPTRTPRVYCTAQQAIIISTSHPATQPAPNSCP
jgi:hypothetical protein